MKLTLTILAASLVASVVCAPARADAIFSILPTPVIAPAGEIGGTFDVVVTNNGGSGLTIGGFAFEVSVTDPDITLTGADFSPVVYPYIFAGNSFDENNSLTLNYTSGATLDASDTYATAGSGTSLGAGQSLSLGEVTFNVASPATPGSYVVSFTGTPTIADANNLSDNSGNPITVDSFSGGTITIAPEPSSLLLALTAIGAFAAARRKLKA